MLIARSLPPAKCFARHCLPPITCAVRIFGRRDSRYHGDQKGLTREFLLRLDAKGFHREQGVRKQVTVQKTERGYSYDTVI